MTAPNRDWARRRKERRLIRLERRMHELDNRAIWETDFGRWGPAQEHDYQRERAKIVSRYDALADELGIPR